MELKQLQYFLTVAEFENYHRASDTLHISQPTLSQSVARLEEELGCRLFERSGRSIRLSEYGRQFYDYAFHAITTLSDGQQHLQALIAGNVEHINLGATVPDSVTAFLQNYIIQRPHTHIHQVQGPAAQMRQFLENRAIDYAVTIVPIETTEIQWEELYTEPLGVIVSEEHPLAAETAVTLERLRDEPFLINNANTDLSDLFRSFFLKIGCEPDIVFEGEQPELIGQLVAKNYGISLSTSYRHASRRAYDGAHGIRFLEITSPACSITTGIATLRRKVLSPAAFSFCEELKKALRQEHKAPDETNQITGG